MDDFDAWRAQRRREREQETAMYDQPIRDEWSLMLEMCQPIFVRCIVVVITLMILYFLT